MSRVVWQKGGEARVLAVVGEAVTLASTIPSPPGSRIDGTLDPSGQAFRIKIHSSKRTEEGGQIRFILQGRAIDLTREGRATLTAMIATN